MKERQIVDEVCEIIEEKMKIVERWGVPVRRASPLIWKLNDIEFLRVIVAEYVIILRYLLGSGEYNFLYISNSKQRKELEEFATIVVNGLMTYLLRSMLGRTACNYISAWFKLLSSGKWWFVEICDKRTGEVIFSDTGHVSKSPLGVFEAVAHRVGRALAITSSL